MKRLVPLTFQNRPLLWWALFLCLVFFLFRLGIPGWVRDDSDHLNMVKGNNYFSPDSWHATATPAYLSAIISNALDAHVRQLSTFQRYLFSSLVILDPRFKYLIFLVNAILVGLTGAVTFALFRKLLRSELYGIAASAIFIFSQPVLVGATVVAGGTQCIVALAMATAILNYVKFKESSSSESQRKYLIFVALSTVVGSYFREFVGVTFLIILLDQLMEKKRSGKLIATLCICFFLVVFPDLLLAPLYYYYQKPIRSGIFSVGLFSVVLSQHRDAVATVSFGNWFASRFSELLRPYGVFFAFYPIFNAVAVGACGYFGSYSLWRILKKRAREDWRADLLEAGGCLIFFSLLIGAYFYRGLTATYCLLALAPIFYLFPRNRLLALWFALALLPFAFVYTMPIHLMYALLPASCFYVLLFKDLTRKIGGHGRSPTPMRLIQLGFVAFVILSAGLSVYAVFEVNRRVQESYLESANLLSKTVTPKDVVVFNGVSGVDIYYDTPAYGFDPYFLQARGKEFVDLEKLLASGKRIFFLNVNRQYDPPNKVWYYGFNWLYQHWVSVRPVAVLSTVDVNYATIDPLQLLYKSSLFLNFIGPPDAIGDFYYGPTKSNFLLGHSAQFQLYEVTGHTATYRDFTGQLKKVSDYRGFRIYEQGGVFFPIPESDKEELPVIIQSNYRTLTAFNMDEAKMKVDDCLAKNCSLDRFDGINF